MTRWSKLKKDLENLMDSSINFQIYSNSYPIGSHGTSIPRFYITINKHIVWDFPKDFTSDSCFYWGGNISLPIYYPIDISDRIRNYINTPRENLLSLEKQLNDQFNLIYLLLSCDKRIGKRKLSVMLNQDSFKPFTNIIKLRLYPHEPNPLNVPI